MRSDHALHAFEVPTADGWRLAVTRLISPAVLDPSATPILIVPGYGMNSHALRLNPHGRSIKGWLADTGREVWTVDLRGHGHSRPAYPRAAPASLTRYATVDLPTAVAAIQRHTLTRRRTVALLGVSLGGSLGYGYLATHPDAPVTAMIAMSSPLLWREVPPLIRAAFVSRRLAGLVPITGARPLARVALPTLGKLTPLLSAYVNARRVPLRSVPELVKTVESPPRAVNRQLAAWLKHGHLEIDGVHVPEALARVKIPLLVVLANRDGIVPAATALSVVGVWGGDHAVLEVGDEDVWYAHADPYVAPDAHERVFAPIATWLAETEAAAQSDTRESTPVSSR